MTKILILVSFLILMITGCQSKKNILPFEKKLNSSLMEIASLQSSKVYSSFIKIIMLIKLGLRWI